MKELLAGLRRYRRYDGREVTAGRIDLAVRGLFGVELADGQCVSLGCDPKVTLAVGDIYVLGWETSPLVMHSDAFAAAHQELETA
jgi:hypothetical protein